MSELSHLPDRPAMPSAPPPGLPERFAAIIDSLPDAILCVNREWRLTYANPEAIRISRLRPEQFFSEPYWDLFPDTLGTEMELRYRRAMASGERERFEFFYPPFDVWIDIHVLPADDGFALFYRDITQQKRSEAREQETARRLAQALEATSDSVAVLDREWRYSYLNSNARRLIDPHDNLIGRNVWEAFPNAVGGPAWEIYHRSMNEGVAGTAEFYYPEPISAWLAIQSQPTEDGIVVFFRDITERKLHEEVVRRQQELLAAVQQGARLATWELDLDSGHIVYGPGSYPVLGHPLDQVATLQARDRVMLPGHPEKVRAALSGAVASRAVMVVEFAVTAADGSVRWVESRGQAVSTADGVRLRGMSIDVTERKLDQQHLLASEARYRVLADLNPQAIWMGDAAGDITYANHGLLSYIGLRLDELAGFGWLQAFAPEDRDRVVEVWSRSFTTGVDYDIEAHLRRAETGEYRWWHLRAAPVRDASGAILHWLGVGSDIHDAKTYAETLRAEQAETERRRAELETIYRTTPVGLALLDPVEFRFQNLNDYQAAMLGLPKERLLGRPLTEFAPPETLPGLKEMMRSVASGSIVKDGLLEGEFTAWPGELRAWRVNYSPILNEDGSVRAISTASTEITNQKKAEAALIQSEKLAAVGRLASSISHEINNPLEAITNLLYLIAMNEKLPSELRGYVHMAQSELSRVSQIATQTLRFHRQAVAPTQVTAMELVGAVVRLYTGRLANSNIKVDARYASQTQILCFENDIRQVLNNLIANAIDAMRTGGRLIVRAHDCNRGGCKGVRIAIADTGHGMSPAVLARAFEPFFTTKDLNGTGLGLWISAGIVERHHGRLRVRSSDAPRRHGTVFTLFLPCKES